FFPGFTESEPSSVYHRARTSAFTTYIDGVPVRSMLGIVIEPPLNAIDALIITKASSAAGTAAASVEYSTLRGSGAWHLDAGVHSNALSPSAWDQKQTRF